MLANTLRDFDKAYKKLWLEIRDVDKKKEFIAGKVSPDDILILEKLIKYKIYQLNAFELLLKISPDNALDMLKKWYLSLDLSCHEKDQVSDLQFMFSDIKQILGRERLMEILNCAEFTLENRKNKRVIEAIEFAIEDD